MKTMAIVNPTAGWRQALRKWPPLLKAMGQEATHVVTCWTQGPGHAENLAAQARREGFDRVIVAGGDGTLFEVVNGLWWEPKGQLPSLGVIPFGTSCDYVRNFDIGHNLAENLVVALGEHVVPVDAGICQLQGLDGKSCLRIFVNILGLGFDGNLIQRFRRRRLRLRGKIPYVISGLQEWIRLKYYFLRGEIGQETVVDNIIILALGLGRCFGGSFMITPGASPQSGRFQVVRLRHMSRLEGLCLVPRICAGDHLNHPKVQASYASYAKIMTDPPAYVEAEGEPLGRTPLEARIFPRAFLLATKLAK